MDYDKNPVDNVLPSQQSLESPECSFLNKLKSIPFEISFIQDIDTYNKGLVLYGLNIQSPSHALDKLWQLWRLRAQSIPDISHQVRYKYKYSTYLNELLGNPGSFEPEVIELIKATRSISDELENHILKLNPHYHEIYKPKIFGLFPPFKSLLSPTKNIVYIDQAALFSALTSIAVQNEYLLLLEPTFNKLRHNIDEINDKTHKLDKKETEIISSIYVIHSVMEVRFKETRRLIDGMGVSQNLYLSICSLLDDDFTQENIAAYRNAYTEFEAHMATRGGFKACVKAEKIYIEYMKLKEEYEVLVGVPEEFRAAEEKYLKYLETEERYLKAQKAYMELQRG